MILHDTPGITALSQPLSLSLSLSHDIHLPSTSRSWASLSLRSRLLKHSIAMVFFFDLESICTTTERQVFHMFMHRIKLELMFFNWFFFSLDVLDLTRLDCAYPLYTLNPTLVQNIKMHVVLEKKL